MRSVLIALLFLTGCAGQPGTSASSTRLALLAPLIIPAESASVRLQYGHPVASNAVQEYDPFCVFELNTVSDTPQTVHPDMFQVTRISHAIDGIAAASDPPYPVMIKAGLFQDHRPTHIYYKTLFWLFSEKQPAARLLTCMSNQNLPTIYPFMRHLTSREIRDALGTGFRLETP